jgi:1-acyl-sn-glycerol-3-phosphate acyltransferase
MLNSKGHIKHRLTSSVVDFPPSGLIGFINSFLLGMNVLFWTPFIFVLSFLKFILPIPPLRKLIGRILPSLAENWITCNSLWMRLTQKTKWDIQGAENFNYHGWYLVISNHQSWADIFIMQHLLNRRIPFLKFFLKRELIWVPVIGLAWWALDFPFMRRHSSEYVKRHPEQRGKDFATTRKACEKFAYIPTSVMNFPEGTRFSRLRHDRQLSPYEYLLRPKAGGLALALSVLGDKFHSLLNITIVYPDGIPTFWEFLCGKVKRVVVHFQSVEVPQQLLHGDYLNDPDFRDKVNDWINQFWQEKDRQIKSLMKDAGQQ